MILTMLTIQVSLVLVLVLGVALVQGVVIPLVRGVVNQDKLVVSINNSRIWNSFVRMCKCLIFNTCAESDFKSKKIYFLKFENVIYV